jgi:hypothetical protein
MSHVIENRKDRWCQFLSNPSSTHLFLIDYQPDYEPPPLPWRENKQDRIEWAWRQYEKQMNRITWLKDDSLPYLHVRTGTEIFAEAFGCSVYYPDDNMPFALPLIHSASEVSELKIPELSSSSIAYLFDMADELIQRAGPGALLQIIDIQTPMDIAALIWDKLTFYPALVEAPEAVLELADKVKQFLMMTLDTWFDRYGKEFIAHYPAYYMSKGITLSEDEIGAVSKKIYDDLFFPELTELSQRYGGIGVHCCAHATHQWEGLANIPGLKLINLVQPESVLRLAYQYFAHIPQMHSWCGDGPPWTWTKAYPDKSRVVIQATAKSREDALLISDKLRPVCGRD